MNATWKSWLNRLMNRGFCAIRALGFTTRRSSRMLRVPGLRHALGALALSGALGTVAWGQAPADDGVIRLGAAPTAAEGVIQMQGSPVPMAAPQMTYQPAYPQQAYQPTPEMYGYTTPYNPYQSAPVMADRTWANYEQSQTQGVGYSQTANIDQVLYRTSSTFGDIYGATDGYTSINAFVPFATNGDNALFYIQPRANVTHEGNGMANVGLGYRFYTPDDNRVWSSTFWWDGDGGHNAFYNQVGGHFSSVGKYLTWRGGFALPIGKTTDRFGGSVSDIFYVDDEIGLNVTSQVETAYRRYDLEASSPLPYFGRYGIEGGVGMYYLSAPDADSSMGVSGRVEAQVTDDFWVNALVTSDEIFGGNFSVNMEVTLPNGATSRWFRPRRVRDNLTASDKRNYRVAAHVQNVYTQERAIDPLDGAPIKVAHIDPNLLAPGNGMIQSPFQSVLEFESLGDASQSNYDIIFVRRRDDGTDTNLNTTVTLFNGQRLLGDGTLPMNGVHTFEALVRGNLGTYILPEQTAGALPMLSNSGNPGLDVVRLAHGNEVSGFIIDATNTAAAIRGTNINGFNINSIGTRNAVEGVLITSDTSVPNGLPLDGIGIIANNLGQDLNGNGVIDDGEDPTGTGSLGIEGSGYGSNRGVSITHVGGELDLVVRNNYIGNFKGEDRNNNGLLDPSEDLNLNGVLDPGEDANANGVLDLAEDTNTNGLLDRGVGLEVIADNGTVINANGTPVGPGLDPYPLGTTTGIANNRLDGNGFGASLQALDGSTFNASIVSNTIRNSSAGEANNGAGIEIISDNSVINLDAFVNNQIYNNAWIGASILAQNSGLITIDDGNAETAAVSGNFISANGSDGLQIISDNSDISIDEIANNLFGSEDLNLNGVLDTGEDLNGNGVMDGGNGGNGLSLLADNGGNITVTEALTGNRFNGNDEDGLSVTALSGTITAHIGQNNQFANNGDDGASFTTGPTGLITTSLDRISATGNGEAGVRYDLDGGEIALSYIQNSQFNQNNIGLAIVNSNGGQFTTPIIANNQFNDNTQAGLLIGGNGGVPTAVTDLGTIINNEFNRTNNGFYGIQFDSLDVSVTAVLRQNDFIGRGAASGAGIGGTVGGTGGVNLDLAPNAVQNGNLFQANGDAHIGLILTGSTNNVINIANHVFDSAVDSSNAAFQSNFFGGDGVAMILRQEANLTGSVSSSRFTNNAADGLRLEIFSESLTGFAQLNNFMIGGATTAAGNLFDGNLDDGIQVSRTGSGRVNNVTIQNNLIRNTGISNIAALDRRTNGSATYSADTGNINEVIDGNTGETQGNGFVTEGDDGIFLSARGVNSQDSYRILNNTITNNSDNAVHVKVAGEASINVEVRNNNLSSNEGNGIALTEEAAFMVGDTHYITGVIAGNQITNNQFNGIYEAVSTDGLRVGEAGASFSNVITGNGLNGVAITGIDSPQTAVGAIKPFLTNPYSTRYLNNLVANNTGAGNQISSRAVDGGAATVTSLGRASIDSREQAGHGFDIDTAVGKVIRIEDSLIRNNAHDGIEFQNGVRNNVGGDGGLGTSVLQVVNNTIEFNGDRGIDVLNKLKGVGAVSSIIVIEGNNISNNEEEGVYIVNTNSNQQRQNNSSSVNLLEDGAYNGSAYLQVTMRDNGILGNGTNVDQTPPGVAPEPIRASGLVVRVGTSGGGYGFTNTGGFATEAHSTALDTGAPVPAISTGGVFEEDFNNNGILDADEDLNGDSILNTGFGVAGLVNAGVLMEVTGNNFAGNYGDDMFFHSFRSTEDPPATTGNWSTTEFTNVQYWGDPLARMDLVFGNNTWDTAEFTPRSIAPNSGTTDGQPGAYYDNAEGNFKSRTVRADASTGPFAAANRRRNAQRLADRTYPSGQVLSPNPGTDGNRFLYAGMGDSTFRVRGVGDMAGSLNALFNAGFILDNFPLGSPIDGPFDANGTFFNGGGRGFGELPFGWGNW